MDSQQLGSKDGFGLNFTWEAVLPLLSDHFLQDLSLVDPCLGFASIWSLVKIISCELSFPNRGKDAKGVLSTRQQVQDNSLFLDPEKIDCKLPLFVLCVVLNKIFNIQEEDMKIAWASGGGHPHLFIRHGKHNWVLNVSFLPENAFFCNYLQIYNWKLSWGELGLWMMNNGTDILLADANEHGFEKLDDHFERIMGEA